MKTFILIIAAITFSQFSFGQIAFSASNVDSSAYIENSKTDSNASLAKLIFNAHSKAAEKQIRAYLNKNLTYSHIMKDYGIEGHSKIEVILDEKGQLTNATMLGSPHDEVSALILKTILEFERISIKNQDYKGANKIQLDINFSLQ